jgi:hypothetical protein
LREEWSIEWHVEDDTLEECVLGLRVHQASFVQNFFKMSLIAPRLPALRIKLNSHNFFIWLVLSGVPRVVLLALVEVVVAVALLVIVVLGEAIVLLVLLISPLCHHVTHFHSSSRAVASEVVVRVLRVEAILEAADDVLVGDVGDSGSHLEETLGVGSQELEGARNTKFTQVRAIESVIPYVMCGGLCCLKC